MLSASPATHTRKDDEPKHKANEAKKIHNHGPKKDSKDIRNEKDNKLTTDWTPAQDAKLLEMKAANKSWKDIEIEIGKPRPIAQPRFKELQAQGKVTNGTKDGKDNRKNTTHEQKKAEYRKEWEAKAKENQKQNNESKNGNQHKNETDKGKADQEKKGQASKDNRKQDQTKPATEKKYTLAQLSKVEDRNFTIRELSILTELVAGLDAKEKATWEVVASRYFDRSGCRVDGEDLKERFEALDKV